MHKQMKNFRNKFILVFTMALMAIGAKAQQVPLFNQYYYSGSLAYPSGTVFQENRYVSFVYRDQFGGLVGSPKNFALAYSTAVKNKTAFSGNITTADIGFTSQVKISGGIGYKLFGEGKEGLSIGAQLGLSLFSLNKDRVNPENPVDNVLLDILGQNGSVLSVDLSASYRKGKFGVDVAIPTIINESLSDDAYTHINDDNAPDFIGGVRYLFDINPDINFTPYGGVRIRETIGAELDIIGEMSFRDKFRATLGYRDNFGVSIGLGVQIFPKILFTYNYDFGQKDTPFLADGFNEFGLHLKLDTKVKEDCALAGEEVVNTIIDQGIYDENLVKLEDREKALCYFRGLEEGKRKEINLNAEAAYQALFAKVKSDELAKLEKERLAKLQAEQQEQERLKREREAIEIERLRLQEIERLAREETKRKEAEAQIAKVLIMATEEISFGSGSSNLTESSLTSLDKVAALFRENNNLKLAIRGYTDNSGNADSNLQLSKERADSVKEYLISKGVTENRISAEGFGIANPRADNSTKEGRAKNRRVELAIVK
ncbi:type IX secretion system PorP/SprF family membrane protein [Roseivirga ehrenbergii]|uniref:OmpA-like domain-containing protein n=1 Tax=Roseivirga ehrenbergii (strain DSM 102268 / JCM 13514 / KCTC 12282 / NCIMB 14502 / KMM 6017) TaxID=279360 RepID=A0A150WXA7_ROSEK|nr:PorP/SprF family type IX secretion system membrane protein [Roseivirga ehrenbergii]KYG71137.1 hypothetical protein MB14_11890 [Roseivirga ehrenbergii]TCK99068.1 type IX secretion system PorP/SprF family membrane protein [Roseivirga ehrenbergii]